ncbi:phosphatase PAP2 family protein [Patescibacteria group bacterium]|nr:phosphatase PAP2 family protein [Patescibacteria group bacterium]
METLLSFDKQLFLVVNHLPHTALLNAFFLGLSGIGAVGLVWFVLAGILFLREERKHHWFFAPIVLAGAGSYLVAEMILKNLVARPRPSLAMGAIILGSPSTDYSFPSGHATIAFAMAVVLSKIEPRWRPVFYLLAVAISFSRLYVGKHFPLDLLGGALAGYAVGHCSWQLARFIGVRLNIVS